MTERTLQVVVHRLEINISTDQFQEIDEVGMRGPPDAHLHSHVDEQSVGILVLVTLLNIYVRYTETICG
jgi:hypothetical protein